MSAATCDVVVVGAGLAGLVAADRLAASCDVRVLEADTRPGGRILSTGDEAGWLNFGAHMFGGPGTRVGDLCAALGLPLRPIAGRLFGIEDAGRLLLRTRPEALPFVLELPPRARLSLVRMGLVLRAGSGRRTPRPADAERTLTAAMGGRLHPRVAALLASLTERCGGDPQEISAAHAFRSFANVWRVGAPGNTLEGGSARLPQALAARLGERLTLGATVLSARKEGDRVRITHTGTQSGTGGDLLARAVVLAVPAPAAHAIAPGLPADTRAALAAIRYGPFLTASLHTAETAPPPWDETYAVATPARIFSVLFNQATGRFSGGRGPSQGSLMVFAGARRAAALMALSDAEIAARVRADLAAMTLQSGGIADAPIHVQRWPLGAPFGFPGRAALQPALTRPMGPFVLAGDYLDFPNMEAAAASGEAAAARVALLLGGAG
ncbi:flavin monoamine oxidase family protein [Acuticoccus yangtzensis]|uniref:flavin monoamine oxidase family protein n=1 Tax=Acuticoccus yangtzensis TaxID=1443441 RepID=UPI000949AAC4|nr:FAD-dependent oxidoreductase [Acuticoccus yangtzensis]